MSFVLMQPCANSGQSLAYGKQTKMSLRFRSLDGRLCC